MHFSVLLSFPIFLIAFANSVDPFNPNPSSSDASADTTDVETSNGDDSFYAPNDAPAESSDDSVGGDTLYAFNEVPAESGNPDDSAIANCNPQSSSDSSLVPESSPDQQTWSNLNVLKSRQNLFDGIMQLVKPKPKAPTAPSSSSCRSRAFRKFDVNSGVERPGYPDWALKCEGSDYFFALCCIGVPYRMDKRSLKIARQGPQGLLNVGGCIWGKFHCPLCFSIRKFVFYTYDTVDNLSHL